MRIKCHKNVYKFLQERIIVVDIKTVSPEEKKRKVSK